MKLTKLILDKFITFDHLEYEFEEKPLLVQGLNLTDQNQKSNGAGKSGMASGIEMCITASNSRGVRDMELVSYGHSEARAQLFAVCDIRKEEIHIDWAIKVKGSNKLILSKKKEGENWEEVSFSNVNDGKKYILEWFAISKDDLFNYYIINKARFKSFFGSSNKDKVDLINRFSDASIISGLENIDNDELESEKTSKQSEIDRNGGKLEMTIDKIDLEKGRDFKEELKAKIDDIKDDIKYTEEEVESNTKAISNSVLKIEDWKLDVKDETEVLASIEYDLTNKTSSLSEISNTLKEAQLKVDEFKGVDLSKDKLILENDIDSLDENNDLEKDSLKSWEVKSQKLKTLLNQISVKLSGTITCPSCEHDFILDCDESVEDLMKNRTKANELVLLLDTKMSECESNLEKGRNQLDSLSESIQELVKIEQDSLVGKSNLMVIVHEISAKLRNHQTQLDRLQSEARDSKRQIQSDNDKIADTNVDIKRRQSDIKKSKEEILEYESNIEGLKIGENKSLITTLKKDLKSLESIENDCTKQLTDINDKIYLRNQWKNNFKQFRGFLANQSLEVIKFHCNRYLHDMGSDLTVEMEGYKMLANGSIKDEISIKVLRCGVERTVSSFSGGEQGRLLFASILANRHMINKTHPYGGLDFLSIDEIFEGVDGVGLTHLIESAKNLNVSAMIITHVTDENASSDVLTIVKENGISIIKQN